MERARRGTLLEPHLLCECSSATKMGLAYPIWNIRLNCIADAVIGDDGILEIKTTGHLPESLVDHRRDLERGVVFSGCYHAHIPEHHYVQMQGTMAIMDRSWCDYYIYQDDSAWHLKQVPFNIAYWNSNVHPKLEEFLRSLDDILDANDKQPTMTIQSKLPQDRTFRLGVRFTEDDSGEACLQVLPLTSLSAGDSPYNFGLRTGVVTKMLFRSHPLTRCLVETLLFPDEEILSCPVAYCFFAKFGNTACRSKMAPRSFPKAITYSTLLLKWDNRCNVERPAFAQIFGR